MKNKRLSNIIISPDTMIHDALKIIDSNGFRGIFICDENKELLGIVMDADIRRAILSNLDLSANIMTIMRTAPFVIKHDVALEKKKELFIKSGKILAPIIDDNNCVIDFIYLQEVLKELYDKQHLVVGEKNPAISPPQKVLVIGGSGYIGTVLVEKLLRMGYEVRILDLLLYDKNSLNRFKGENLELIRGDCRNENKVKEALKGVNAVVHLGEIVGDPACNINESFTIDTNYSATHMIVEQCITQGVNRFVFASSCSVYGHNDREVDEDSITNPVSLYARCKIESEKAILSHNYNHFCPTILRLATVHGRSYRQRFDLVVNLLTMKALAERKIQIFGGEQWRPFISIEDVCQGIIMVLHEESRKIKNQIFNLGDSRENYQLIKIGKIISDLISGVELELVENKSDKRNYRVSFERIKNQLGFSAVYKISDSVKSLVSAYNKERLFHDYQNNKYHNVLSLKK